MPYELGYYDLGDDMDELLGDDLLGDYDDDEMGARRGRRRRGRSSRIAQAIAKARSGVSVKKQSYTKGRELVLGVDSVSTVAGGASTTVTTQPQVPFSPYRFIVSATVAASFLVTDLKIGKNSQFVSSDAVPAEAFSNVSVGVQQKMDTAQVSQIISVAVTNTSGGALRFTGAFYGRSIE